MDPTSLAHTQRIEGMWRWIKAKAIPRSGVKMEVMELHLSAVLYERFLNSNQITFIKDFSSLSEIEVQKVIEERKRLDDEEQDLLSPKFDLPIIQDNEDVTAREPDKILADRII